MTNTITTAVAAVEKAAAEPTQLEKATALIARQYDTFAAVMPDGLNRDRFSNLVTSLVRRTPALIECVKTPEGRTSLALAALECAALGLEPNTPLKEASIVPRKRKGKQEAQLMVEYRGLVKLARRSGELSTIGAEVVHERDEFEYSLGLEPSLRHVPYDGDDDPGELRYCYAVAKFKDGSAQFVVVPRRVVHKNHRARSDSFTGNYPQYSPWTTDTEQMWRKTAIRVLEPFLPLTADTRRALTAVGDGVVLAMDGGEIVPEDAGHIDYQREDVIDVETGEITAAPIDTTADGDLFDGTGE
jgi:recombination protein RecT